MGRPLSLAEKIHIFKQRPDFVCLPEYWLMDDTVTDHHRAALLHADQTAYLSRLSDELDTTLIAGTTVDPADSQLANTCTVFRSGEVLGRYRKRNLMPGELKVGMVPGKEPLVVDIDGIRVAVLICGDVFTPGFYDQLAQLQVDLIFIPTASPHRERDRKSEKAKRDQAYFVEGAMRSGAFVVKVCGVGSLFGKPLQGRSLIAAPWGILSQVQPEDEATERIMTETFDFDELREFRKKRQLVR
jgi:predicted amidohydrolase